MFNFGLSTICIIIEMKMGASGMLLRHAFDYRFSGLIKERLKRQCSKPYSYFTNSSPYQPPAYVPANYSDLLKLRPPDTNKLPGHKLASWGTGELSTARAFRQKTLQNMTTKDNAVTPLPINLYAVGPTRHPATWFNQIRTPSFSTTHAIERSNRVFVHL